MIILQINVNPSTAFQAQTILQELGLDLNTAINIFLEQTIYAKAIPFEIIQNIHNADTIEALKEVEAMKKDPSLGKSYTNVDDMMEDLLKNTKFTA